MITAYLKEKKEYTREELKDRLNCGDDMLNGILGNMTGNGMTKVKEKGKEQGNRGLSPDEIEREKDISCTIDFVGVIVAGDCVLRCYPKYIPGEICSKEEMQQVMEVIGKYKELAQKRNKDKKIITTSMEEMDDSSDDDSFSLLSLMRWILLDYYENGIYSNTRDIIETNGDGEILWDKTINGTVPIIHKGRPYYTDLFTRKHVSDEYDYCRRLHQCILTEISAMLKGWELLDLFRLTEVELTDEKQEDFGEKGYILYRIERELNTQFNTRKQLLLRNMYDYIAQEDTLHAKGRFTFLGVSRFDPVWQDVCAEIMDNQFEKKLNELPFPKGLQSTGKLSDEIKKPKWSKLPSEEGTTLIPDLISIKKINGEWNFIIFDAKYYDADVLAEKKKIEKRPEKLSLPGVPDISKQYLYQLAYQPFIRDHGFKARNCFLMPTAKEEIGFGGKVSLDMLGNLLQQMLGGKLLDELKEDEKYGKRITEEMVVLQDIKVRFLPVSMAYDYYINDKKFDIAALELDNDERDE